ncbi:MAG TPA: hypothetical protein VGI39_35235 [Polyangiaceae bacterium]|jgi:hypothetical protein
MRLRESFLPLLALLVPLALPGAAFAQTESGVIAEGLFREGRTLLAQGKIDQACDKFEASERVASAPGTRLNLALCREQQGRTATAWSLFAEVEAVFQRSGDDRRAALAHAHRTALAGQLKKVVIEVVAPPPGMVVKLDGLTLPSGALGTEIPLDPGTHALAVTAPGKKPWEQAALALGPEATALHVRVQLEDERPAAQVVAKPPEVPATPVTEPVPPSPAEGGGHSEAKRYIGYGVGGVGLVALGFATYYGVTALSRKNAEGNYPEGSPDRLTVYNQASGAQTAELIVGAFGIVCVGTGLYLILTSRGPDARAATTSTTRGVRLLPSAGPGGGGLLLHGRF